MNTIEAARGRWRFILTQFGIEESHLRNLHGPCPICGGRDRFRWDDKDGTGSYFCSQCGPGYGLGLLMKVKGWDFPKAAKEVDSLLPDAPVKDFKKPESDPGIALDKVTKSLRPAGADVKKYLSGRGLYKCPPGIYQVTRTYFEEGKKVGRYECMCAPIQDVNGNLVSYHLTHLYHGRKADVPSPRKIMRTRGKLNGCAVRLVPLEEHIGIAEGIETAIAAMFAHKIPCWSAINEGMMRAWEPPKGIKRVTIFGDNDENFVGQRAAYELALRLHKLGIKTEVFIPTLEGSDMLDEWNARAA